MDLSIILTEYLQNVCSHQPRYRHKALCPKGLIVNGPTGTAASARSRHSSKASSRPPAALTFICAGRASLDRELDKRAAAALTEKPFGCHRRRAASASLIQQAGRCLTSPTVARSAVDQGFGSEQHVIGPEGRTFPSSARTSSPMPSADAVAGWDHPETVSMTVVVRIRMNFLTRARVNNLSI